MTNKNISIYVGLYLEHAWYNVLGVDVFPDYVYKINNKTLGSPEPSLYKMLNDSTQQLTLIYVATPSGGEKWYFLN